MVMAEVPTLSQLVRDESCCISSVRRVAAMLNLHPQEVREGQALPRGWHFFMLGADTRRAELRGDGFPGFGMPMPELGLPRLLIVNRTVDYLDTLTIGAKIRRVSALTELKEKANSAGPMALATFSHELFVEQQSTPSLVETQTFMLLGAGRPKAPSLSPIPASAQRMKTFLPDESVLFQYSALGFNSHKIHIDKLYAREVEGFPDLVVNGGLTSLIMTEFARLELGLDWLRMRTKHVAPLFCGRPITLAADCIDGQWRLKAFDDTGILAAEMELDLK